MEQELIKFKDSVFHMCLVGAVVAVFSNTRGGRFHSLNPFKTI